MTESRDFLLTLERPNGQRLEANHNRQVPSVAGDQYVIVVRSNVSQRALIHLSVDGLDVSGPGFVLRPWGTLKLEGPYQAVGRFTVCQEGDAAAFGPDGGKGNPALGLIEARIQTEAVVQSVVADWRHPSLWPRPYFIPYYPFPNYPLPYNPWHYGSVLRETNASMGSCQSMGTMYRAAVGAESPVPSTMGAFACTENSVSQSSNELLAAGTALAGDGQQHFAVSNIGPLNPEETRLSLRLVIGPPLATPSVRPLPGRIPTTQSMPPRPGA